MLSILSVLVATTGTGGRIELISELQHRFASETFDADAAAFRMFWASFITDVPTPDFKVGPFALMMFSEPLSEVSFQLLK